MKIHVKRACKTWAIKIRQQCLILLSTAETGPLSVTLKSSILQPFLKQSQVGTRQTFCERELLNWNTTMGWATFCVTIHSISGSGRKQQNPSPVEFITRIYAGESGFPDIPVSILKTRTWNWTQKAIGSQYRCLSSGMMRSVMLTQDIGCPNCNLLMVFKGSLKLSALS